MSTASIRTTSCYYESLYGFRHYSHHHYFDYYTIITNIVLQRRGYSVLQANMGLRGFLVGECSFVCCGGLHYMAEWKLEWRHYGF